MSAADLFVHHTLEVLASVYLLALQYVDSAFARLVAALKAAGLYESTAIIISAKHGQVRGCRLCTEQSMAGSDTIDNNSVVQVVLAVKPNSLLNTKAHSPMCLRICFVSAIVICYGPAGPVSNARLHCNCSFHPVGESHRTESSSK